MYKFERKKLSSGKTMAGNNVAEILELDDDQAFQAVFLGKVKTLFGEPDYSTADMEDLYSYEMIAIDENQTEIPLEIYYGPSGPSIAAPTDEEHEQAVLELAQMIMDAKPSDYEIRCVYEDVGVTVIMGVKQGQPYYKSLFPGMTEDMTEEEMMAFFEEEM